VNGSVQSPGVFPFRDGIKLEDLLFLAGGLSTDAYKERIIIYRKGLNQKMESISLSLTDQNKEDIYLYAGDIIHVQSLEKMSDIGYVTILGEVKKPGIIPFADSLSLQDVIVLSEGLNEFASVSNIEIVRRVDSINLFSTNSELTKSINVDLSTLLNGKKVDCLILGSILLHLADWRVDLQKFVSLGVPRIIVHRQPIIIEKATYFQFKNAYKTKMFEWIINRDEIIGFFKEGGYELIYETSMSSELIYDSSQPITITLSFSKL
jgi:hypothetical protein